ncbi:class I SAM-dependent methyltransferase [Ancylobacter polymorphus]|uniref:2-polyprenyl-6-hydroxyphenyl methylase/3-demethylubiquinone-9 3-methyltransferase n=1 Tax=Ancylobacter polymorphus TaxID=223390 RepID=A0ABU0BFR9_9HYPH|nr:class I SAM-dependent methyltransferase [Ancylobacter polymorphus]MDQ0304678.1 2-polyprenyl-6-hydroxyphenyl methylase/3-demethylubiquinone-9 3-methyltransferase [Ancylobacter polymorphus]
MSCHFSSNDLSAEEALKWFADCGNTDAGYLQAHWSRFQYTYEFAMAPVSQGARLDILDVGCHWLHNALLYARAGHRVTCIDGSALVEHPSVIAAAERMGASLLPMRRMETGDGLLVLPDNSVDLVLFCEIIEHIAFNPIPFWKEIYRILRPGGRIIITTPNALYHRSIDTQINRLLSGRGGFGITVNDIMETGTYGHHWKEYSLPELRDYFARLSSDFDTSRHVMATREEDLNATLGPISELVAACADVRAHSIYLDVVLTRKDAGISISPPWIPPQS